MSTIQSEHFAKALLMVLDETFDNVHGYYLDRNTSLFETLSTITAEEASIPVGGKCATLAAQVKHVVLYLDVIEKFARNPHPPQTDWGEIWRTVSQVTPEEWAATQVELRASYNRILEWIKATPAWLDEVQVGIPIGLIAHIAYHLGEIRQALCTLR